MVEVAGTEAEWRLVAGRAGEDRGWWQVSAAAGAAVTRAASVQATAVRQSTAEKRTMAPGVRRRVRSSRSAWMAPGPACHVGV